MFLPVFQIMKLLFLFVFYITMYSKSGAETESFGKEIREQFCLQNVMALSETNNFQIAKKGKLHVLKKLKLYLLVMKSNKCH